ncbi:MAG: PaaI thioesterase family protein [Caulobacter sp.]|nr:PaaI thioesterase family protein [Caulobacter sp.]
MADVPPLKMTPDALNAFMLRAFPASDEATIGKVMEAEPGRVLICRPYHDSTLRPGGVISGPTMMGLADMAAYSLVLAHIGEVAMAVTTSLTIHFLRACKPGDLYAEGVMLKLGRRIATCEVTMWTESRERAASKATVAYAIPDGPAA